MWIARRLTRRRRNGEAQLTSGALHVGSSLRRVNGKPVLFIIDVGEMYQIFARMTRVADALAQLRAAAQAQGLPGVYVVGGFGEPDGTLGRNTLAPGFSIAGADGYDAVALYNYPFAPPAVNGELPFSELAAAAHWTWNDANAIALFPSFPHRWPLGPRPWHEVEPVTGDLMWYARTPLDVAALVQDAIDWANSNPQLRPEPAPLRRSCSSKPGMNSEKEAMWCRPSRMARVMATPSQRCY